MNRVLVTGGAGFIGSHTVDRLLEKGYDVRVMDSLQRRVHPRGKPAYVPAEVEFVRGDVARPRDLARALEGVRYVVHLAAYQDYLPDFSRFIHTNAESTARIFELIVARRLPVEKIVLASSQSVAGEGEYHCEEHGKFLAQGRPVAQLEKGVWETLCPVCGCPARNLPIGEEIASPHTAYGISKYALELLGLRLGKRYGIPTVAMRYTYVQGPRNSFYNAYSGILRIFALRLLHGYQPVAFEDGQQLRDYVNVRDVARANVIALEDPRADFQVLNVGGGKPVTVLGLARIVLAAFGSDLEPQVPGTFRLGDTRHTISDIQRMRAMGWEPGTPVEQSVREYLAWVREQPDASAYFLEAEKKMRAMKVLRQAERPAGELVPVC